MSPIMEVHFTLTPEVQAQPERWTRDTECPADELLQDALAGCFEELAATREMPTAAVTTLKAGA
jgi:hypothetical protein